MAVISVNQLNTGEGSFNFTTSGYVYGSTGQFAPDGKNDTIEYVASWEVICDDADPYTALTAPDIPVRGDFYPTDDRAWLKSKSAHLNEESNSNWIWEVTCNFYGEDPSPIDMPAKWTYGSSKYTKAVRYDLDEEPVTNWAYKPLQEALTLDSARGTIQVTKNYFTVDVLALKNLENTVNDALYFGYWEPAWLRCDTVNIKPMTTNGLNYWQVEFNITIAEWDDPWPYAKVISNGYEQLKTASDPASGWERILDGAIPSSTPYLINEQGRRIANASDIDETVPTKNPYILYRIYEESDFSIIPLPGT